MAIDLQSSPNPVLAPTPGKRLFPCAMIALAGSGSERQHRSSLVENRE